MPNWRVHISYWCGFTGDPAWEDRARAALEGRGWTDVEFGNWHHAGYVPFSSNVDGDEIHFVARADRPDRAAVDGVLKQVGIQHTLM